MKNTEVNNLLMKNETAVFNTKDYMVRSDCVIYAYGHGVGTNQRASENENESEVVDSASMLVCVVVN